MLLYQTLAFPNPTLLTKTLTSLPGHLIDNVGNLIRLRRPSQDYGYQGFPSQHLSHVFT